MIAGQATQYSSHDYDKVAVPFEDLFNDKKNSKAVSEFKNVTKKVSTIKPVID